MQSYEDFISGAEYGVVLFSLGYTGFSAKDVPSDVVKALMDAFAAMEQRVIMRFDSSILPHIPSNVMVADWWWQMIIIIALYWA